MVSCSLETLCCMMTIPSLANLVRVTSPLTDLSSSADELAEALIRKLRYLFLPFQMWYFLLHTSCGLKSHAFVET